MDEPRKEFLDLALSCGAKLTGKPDGTEAITVVFTIDAWRAFDAACLSQTRVTTERKGPLSKDQIREVFLTHGFTIKEGQADLKPYVYDAAYALLTAAKKDPS